VDAAQPARILSHAAIRYPVPASRHRSELVIERSTFRCTISRAESVNDAQAFVREMQQEYADATHNCWAYVVGAPGSTSHIGLSDDGEPHGTAGRPMLTVLLHSGVGEIAAVVTRWYGGTKLGTGGLARAYSGAVQQALAELITVQRVDTIEARVTVDYGAVTPVRQLLVALEAEICDEQYAEHVTYDIKIARDCEVQLRTQLADLTRGQAIVHVSHGE
jgi:uncharacterized YigZ family protein